MSRFRPVVEITLDGQSLTGPEAALVSAEVELTTGTGHDWVRIRFGTMSPLADAGPGDPFVIALGYGDGDLETVLTGAVHRVNHGPAGVTLEALAGTAVLSAFRHAGSYLQQTVADIVSDLVSQAGGATGTVDAALQLAAYHVDERRPVWAHIRDLAGLGDYEIAADPDGNLMFGPPRTGASDHTLRYGADLLGWAAGDREPGGIAWAGAPHGAGSEQGAEKWHLLLKDPTGGPPAAPTRVLAAAREQETADAFGEGRGARLDRRASGGQALIVGDSAIRPGDLAELAELPGGGAGAFRCKAVRYRLSVGQGFLSRLELEAA
ncbi:MAG: hypothetical protein ACLFTV_16095 [Desulfococcaceae bacterium]